MNVANRTTRRPPEQSGLGLAPSAATAAPGSVEIGYTVVDGIRVRYARQPGVGPPLLFCNGIGANLELGYPLVCAMPDRSIVLFDIPGVGGSPAVWFWPSLERYARLATGMLDNIGMTGPFVVAGVSWGGALAQVIARRHAQRVRGLILMATSPGILMVPARLRVLLRMVTPQRYLSRTFMARNAATLYGGEMRGRPDLAVEFAELTRAPAKRSYLQQLIATAGFSSLLWLRQLRCPALIVTGDDDPLVRPINGRLLVALLPRATLCVIDGGGHLFMILQPRRTAEILGRFLDGLTGD